MRKIIAVLGICFLLFGFSAKEAFSESFLNKINAEVINSLPSDLFTMRLAVIPLENDKEQVITNSLISALTSSGKYTLVERDQIEKILKEQHLQLSDLVNYKTAIKVGSLAGAEVILFGSVKKFVSSPLYKETELHLRIDSVENGEIIWAKNIKEKWISPYVKKITIPVIILILLLIALTLRKQILISETKAKLGQEEDWRERITVEIDKSLNNLSFSQNQFFEKGDKEIAAKIKEVALTIDKLKMIVKDAPAGITSELVGEKGVKRAIKLDKKVLESIQALTNITRDIKEKTISGSDRNSIEKQIKKAIMIAQELENKFVNRKAYI